MTDWARTVIEYLKMIAVLPLDPEADARFAELEKTLIRRIPRRLIKQVK